MKKLTFIVLLFFCIILLVFIAKRDLTKFFNLSEAEQTITLFFDSIKNVLLTIISIVLGFILSYVPKYFDNHKKYKKELYNKYYAYDIVLNHLENIKDPILSILKQRIEEDETLYKYGTWITLLSNGLNKISFKDKVTIILNAANHAKEIQKQEKREYTAVCNKCALEITKVSLTKYGSSRAKTIKCNNCKTQYKAFVTENGKFRLKICGEANRFPIKKENWKNNIKEYLEIYNDAYLTNEELLSVTNSMISIIKKDYNINTAALIKSIKSIRQVTDNIRDTQLINSFIFFLNRPKFITEKKDNKVFYIIDMINFGNIMICYLLAIIDVIMNRKIYLTYNDVVFLMKIFIPAEKNLSTDEIHLICETKGIKA
jgi:hypothetical protein